MKTLNLILALMLVGTMNALSQIKITGTVTDTLKNPIKGIRVVTEIETGFKSTYSNSKGKYKITVQDTSASLIFYSTDYEYQEIKVGDKTKIDIVLAHKSDTDVMIRKPVIYLYPTAETDVSVRVAFDGDFLFTYPEYGDGWRVTAFPDGRLINKADGREYSYLFWDGLKEYPEEYRTYETGSVVHRDSTVAFLQKILPEMGLLPHEYNEFIVYWTPYLMRNEWNFIHFRTGSDYDAVSVNAVTPRPETTIRVFMDFKGVEAPFDVEPQKTHAPERKGFTLVEWGGMELTQPINIPDHSH